MEFKVIDCCPAPSQLVPILAQIKSETGCVYASVYRGEDPAAQQYLTGAAPCYKHNQAWIYANYPPGVANPPGRSTHELRSDGVAYLGPAGRPLFWWQCGIDVDDAHVQAFIAAAKRHGWVATITYPGSAVEYHHVNFRIEPKFHVFPVLKKGSKGPRVKHLTRKLHFVSHPGQYGKHYLGASHFKYNDTVASAVKRFQADHHLTADGVFGHHTAKQLNVSVRYEKKNRKWHKLHAKEHGVRAVIQELLDKIEHFKNEITKSRKKYQELSPADQAAQEKAHQDRINSLKKKVDGHKKKVDRKKDRAHTLHKKQKRIFPKRGS